MECCDFSPLQFVIFCDTTGKHFWSSRCIYQIEVLQFRGNSVMRHVVFSCVFLCSLAFAGSTLEVADGERIVFLGNTFVERDVQYGSIETALTLAYKDKNLSFRNLGWSGDTVWGHARAGFGSTQDGYNNLIKQVKDAKPTTLFVCYGLSESFDGESGLAPFIAQYNKLLDDVAGTNAKIVIVTPIRHEKLGGALPDADEHNKKLEIYVNALKSLSAQRKAFFLDLFSVRDGAPAATLTDNGIHLTQKGYVVYAARMVSELGATLPATSQAGPQEDLRNAIVVKNQLFFYRWRPQNDTYIFGFRKHEQGRNAVDIPKFDPLIEAKEKEIQELKKAVK